MNNVFFFFLPSNGSDLDKVKSMVSLQLNFKKCYFPLALVFHLNSLPFLSAINLICSLIGYADLKIKLVNNNFEITD